MLKNSIIIITIILFVGNYQICELVYPNDLIKWWGLKQNIYNVIIALSVYLTIDVSNDKVFKFLSSILIGFCISNCIDRIFFDINTFQLSDYLMIIITIITSYLKYVR